MAMVNKSTSFCASMVSSMVRRLLAQNNQFIHKWINNTSALFSKEIFPLVSEKLLLLAAEWLSD